MTLRNSFALARHLCAVGALALCASLAPAVAATPSATSASAAAATPSATTTVVDIVGRTVRIPAKVDRILLGEGRFLYAMALLEGADPLARIAGWQGELPFADPNGYAEYRRRFPQIDRIPVIGRTSEDSVSSEQSVATQPDIAIFGLGGSWPWQAKRFGQGTGESGRARGLYRLSRQACGPHAGQHAHSGQGHPPRSPG